MCYAATQSFFVFSYSFVSVHTEENERILSQDIGQAMAMQFPINCRLLQVLKEIFVNHKFIPRQRDGKSFVFGVHFEATSAH